MALKNQIVIDAYCGIGTFTMFDCTICKKNLRNRGMLAIIDANINSNKFNNIYYIQKAKLKMFRMLLMKLIFYCWIPQELDVMIWSFKKSIKLILEKYY